MHNELTRPMLDAPSIESALCPFCGRPATNRHHIVQKGMGGAKGNEGPTVTVCGMGNASGCHGLLHSGRLHLLWDDHIWWYLRTDEPCSYQDALRRSGWRPVRTYNFGPC